MTSTERLRELGIEWGPNGLTDEGIERLREYVKEHGDVPPEYAALTVDVTDRVMRFWERGPGNS